MKLLLIALLTMTSISVFAQNSSKHVILEETFSSKKSEHGYGEENQAKVFKKLQTNIQIRCDELSGSLQEVPKCHYNWLGYQYYNNENRGYTFLCYQGCNI